MSALDFDATDVIVRVMLTFDRAADDHLDDCARRGFTPRTIATYRRTYDLLSDRLPRDQDVSKITTDDLRRFLGSNIRLAPGTLSGFESHLSSLFGALYFDGKIARNPMDRLVRTKRRRAEDLDVKTVDPDGVRRMLEATQTWPERLALGVLCYLGPRRHAVALLRLRDYDRLHGRLRFREKGGKTIWKPVPAELSALLDAAIGAGVYATTDYLIPPEGYLLRTGDRDDRVIWRIVKRVAERAGVDSHVHALRAAFACFYEEQNPGDVLALRDLMGHASVKTTELYLRRRDKEAGMQRVRGLSWAAAPAGDDEVSSLAGVTPIPTALLDDGSTPSIPSGGGVAEPDKVSLDSTSQIAGKPFASSPLVGAGGFEPPSEDKRDEQTGGGIHSLLEALDPLNHAVDAAAEDVRS